MSQLAGGGRWDRISTAVVVLAGCLLAGFAWFFQPGVMQWRVDALWAGAIVLWMAAVRRAGGSLLPEWPRASSVWLPAALLAVFAICWLPFFNNWRWAYTGDSVAWYIPGDSVARNGLPQNILSTHGVDDNFTFLHSIAFSWPMWVFEPTLFWHRVGKLIVSSLSLAAIYLYFAMMLSRRWAAAIVTCVAVNHMWLWFSYISYGHIDSYIFYFLTLTVATLVWRYPDHLGAWMVCGLIGGLSMFFTQTSWSAVAAAGLVLGLLALATRRFGAAVVYAVSFLLVATPILLQFHQLLDMTTRQARSIFEWPYLVRTFTTILRLPYQAPYHHIGVNGAVLRWPLSSLYVFGAGLAAVAVLPPLRRALRLPPVAPLLAGLFLWDAVLMTLTNNGYGEPSTKRIYSLIPLQVFFALLPAYLVAAWVARWRWLRRAAAVVIAGGIAFYAGANLLLIMYPDAGIYGVNCFDGLIEVRQRFPERRILFAATREGYAEALQPEGFFNQSYALLERLTLAPGVSEDLVVQACAEHLILCYEPNMDRERFQPLLDKYRGALRPLPLLNSVEMECYDCLQPLAAAGGAGPGNAQRQEVSLPLCHLLASRDASDYLDLTL